MAGIYCQFYKASSSATNNHISKFIQEYATNNLALKLGTLQIGSDISAISAGKGHNREDMQADDYQTIPCIFIMGSSTTCGRLLAT